MFGVIPECRFWRCANSSMVCGTELVYFLSATATIALMVITTRGWNISSSDGPRLDQTLSWAMLASWPVLFQMLCCLAMGGR